MFGRHNFSKSEVFGFKLSKGVLLSLGSIVLLLALALIVLFVLYGGEKNKRLDIEQDYQELRAQSGNASREEARQIINKVKKHFLIDNGVEPTVATIVDVETLKKRNPFYKKAKNGDHLIVTPQRAILYDDEKDLILDVIPVQIKPLEQ